MKIAQITLSLCIAAYLALPIHSYAQNPETEKSTIDIFIDCASCNIDYIRGRLTYINYVRDRTLADVHVLVRELGASSGSRTYELNFLGKQSFDKLDHKMTYNRIATETVAEFLEDFTKTLEMGLMPYLASTRLGKKIQIQAPKVPETDKLEAKTVEDPWDKWIFRIKAGGNTYIESQRSNLNVNSDVNAERVTPDIRFRNQLYYNYTQRKLNNDDEVIFSFRKGYGFNGSVVKSINNHWSAGLFGGINSSTFSNNRFSTYAHPAIEYSFFSYEDVLEKEFTIAYKIGPSFSKYFEETIYGKTEEGLWTESLSLQLRVIKDWGNIYSRLEGSHFFHDFGKNSLELQNNLSFRLFKGFFFNMDNSLQLIRNQLSLPKGDVSLEDALLQQKQLATNYQASFALGVSYTFGSIYNNVVNTRL